MLKRLTICLILLMLIFGNIKVLAEDDIDEVLNLEEIDSILKSVVAEVNELPNINSRHAVVYDRKTRTEFYLAKKKMKDVRWHQLPR